MMHDEFDDGFAGFSDGFDDEAVQKPRVNKRRSTRDPKQQAVNLAAFEANWPQVAEWWKDTTFPFAMSMKQAVREWGELTEGQMNATLKAVRTIQSVREAFKAREAAAPVVDVSLVIKAFARAKNSGLSRPIMRVEGNGRLFKLALAPTTGRNAGAIYATENEVYLGKIVGGNKFVRSLDCSDDQEADLLLACADIPESAIRYGRITNNCSCCGKELSNPESVALGIGPICRGKFFG